MTFGQYIRHLRKAKGLSLDEISNKLAITKGYLSFIERGIKRPPKDEIVRGLAEVLGEDATQLLYLAHQEKVPQEIHNITGKIEELHQLTEELKSLVVEPEKMFLIHGKRLKNKKKPDKFNESFNDILFLQKDTNQEKESRIPQEEPYFLRNLRFIANYHRPIAIEIENKLREIERTIEFLAKRLPAYPQSIQAIIDELIDLTPRDLAYILSVIRAYKTEVLNKNKCRIVEKDINS
ncbi:MAG: helix-turn-helix domain-containing protein [bacterium]|nr:helix-turn-helix domain-containing protein [bacterium]